MDRNKRIEEMARAIPDIVQLGGWAWDIALTDSHGLLKKKAIAKEIYNAGYRKADDVRKETLKEVFKELSSYKTIMNFDIVDLSKKYGIDLEEV